MRLALLIGLALAGCAVRPASVTAEAAAGHACYGAECGPNGEVRIGATWDIAIAPEPPCRERDGGR